MDEASDGGPDGGTDAVVAALRAAPLFAGLADDQLAAVATRGERVRLPAGAVIARQGDPADGFYVVLDGVTEWRRAVGGVEVHAVTLGRGDVFAELILMLDAPYPTTGRAVTPVVLLRLPPEDFWAVLAGCPPLLRRLVQVAAERSQLHESVAMQQAKLASLGSLAAGLAHELNNPTSAIASAAGALAVTWPDSAGRSLRLGGAVGAEQAGRLAGLAGQLAGRAADRAAPDPLARSDAEDELTALLEERGVVDAAGSAATLVDAGVLLPDLEELAGAVPGAALQDVVTWLAADLTGRGLVAELAGAAARVSGLVEAVRGYTVLDQAPEQDVDVTEGLEATLAVLAPRLGPGVAVERDYQPDLPRVPARAPELNQVWTQLVANAADAVAGAGRVVLRTAREGDRVLVEVADDGPGIDEQVLPRVFEPFFTTKGVGQGTGLGLDVARRIVQSHGGDLRVSSRPGDTRFTVRLPLGRPDPGDP